MIRELQDRFDDQQVLPPVLALESLIIKAANGEDFSDVLDKVQTTCFKDDLSILNRQLFMFHDIIKEGCPTVKKVTSVRTVCDALNFNKEYKKITSEVVETLFNNTYLIFN